METIFPEDISLIDIDVAIRERREELSGARGKIGIRTFIPVGVLLGGKHSFIKYFYSHKLVCDARNTKISAFPYVVRSTFGARFRIHPG